MVVADKRRNLIISTAGNFFGVSIPDDAESEGISPVLEKFLDHSSCRTLCAQAKKLANAETKLKLSNELPAGRNTLVFFKLKARKVTEENFHDLVQIASTGEGKSSLIEALRQVWAPTLQSLGLDPSFIGKLEEDLLGPKTSSSLVEEEALWRRKKDNAKRSHERKLYEEAENVLKNISAELESAAVSRDGLLGVEEALDATHGFVDDLWKLEGPVYSQERMKSLLDIIGNEVVGLVENFVNEVNSENSRAKDEIVSMGAAVCEKWVDSSERLTTLFWPHHSLHPWKASPVVPNKCSKLGKRLRQISQLRAQHRQLTRLLTPGERSALATDALLQSFDDVEVFLGDGEKDVEWERLKRKVEEGLAPAEEKVAEKLKSQFAGANNPAALAAEFRRYGELMKREGIRRSLRAERETLLSAFHDLVESCQNGPDTRYLLDSPLVLQEIQAARAAELRLESLDKLGKELLQDLEGYNEVASKVISALRDAESRRKNLVDSWVEETKEAIDKKELTLGTDSAVVELTGSKMMRVTYDPRLTTLIREARALSGQGVELPREIRDLVERAGSLAGRAKALQQIATFHNTIGDRMVPSQRPLMLTAALELSRAVREQSGVVWSDPAAVDAYTGRLRELVQKFARQNSELAGKHSMLRDLVSNLLKGDSINLVANQNTWKDTLRNMRSIVDGVEANYGNTKAWKSHWDHQLLKALGVAYRAALPSLLRKLPEIKVELTFRDGSLQWRPSLEEIRAKLYSGIRRFLSIPTNFRGVGDMADAHFADLVSRNAYLYGAVYKEAEILLSSIEALRYKWLSLAAPARIDPGERLRGKPPQQWERTFKEAKQWAQELGKLRGSEVKIWCISIDTGTTRNDLESASRRYWERLSSDLRVEASTRLIAIVEFLSAASKELEYRPRNVEEVGLAYEAQARIQEQSMGIAKEMEAVVGLARVLAAWTREKLDGVTAANSAWQGLTDRLEKHKTVIEKQLEDAKINLRHKAAAFQDEKERWETKWSSKPPEMTLDWISLMRERWSALLEQKESLRTECRRINLNFGDILLEDDESWQKLELELEAEESNCRFQAEFLEELKKQEAEEWAVARRRLPRLHDWLDSWESRIQVQEKKEVGEKGKIDTFVGRKIQVVRDSIEWVQLLKGDEVADEHWAELRPILELNDVRTLRDLCLGHLLENVGKIREHAEKIKDITKRAAAESGIRQALVELESWEGSASLQLQDSADSKNNPITLVGEYGSLLTRAGELRLLLEGAKGAAGYERFAARAGRCEASLCELEERVKILSVLQRKWVYLEPVYGSGAAPNDSGKWSRADKEFRYLMGEISRDPRVPSLRRLPLPALSNLKDLLDRCQRSLDEFLEEKRSAYPRLYFLSDEDLLELVSASGRGLETHLPKLYQGVGSVERDKNLLKAVISPEGEVLKLREEINLNEPLPRWLNNLEEAIRETLRQSLDQCLQDSSTDPFHYPAQVLLLAERIRFTERCEHALKEGKTSLKSLIEYLETQRMKYRGLEDSGDKLTALKARGLLLDTVYHLGVTRNLLNTLANSDKTSWIWKKQLRSYRTNKGPVIRCAGADFPYRFEYQGASVGLVRTPLTERCFLALTQAMKLGLGGSPTGPAGTGKTESVKALGAILGRLVLVFNCDEGMDAGSMKRILGGLARSGAWGCFDEFNRLEEETLSAVAMLVRPLQEAVRDGCSEVTLAEQKIPLDPHCCVFITMNPAGVEYGGRHKLPDSLARLFRPIGMAHPDKVVIVKALLECAGFLEASGLANQLVETLDISEKLLSKQPHYDWGLRALRSVLDALPSETGSSEAARLLAAITASTVSKLTGEDTPIFLGLLNDVFPNTDPFSETSPERQILRATLTQSCDALGLGEDIVTRCLQLNDQLRSRTGVAIVGPPGSGKTLIRRLLSEALERIGQSVKQVLVFPGAVPKYKLLGRVDPVTREWKEGILSNTVSSNADDPIWIILNGDVEPEWAEALNSALDDNRLLTLSNGVGMKLGAGTRFIFETHKLASASPATVSRLGVIHLGVTSPSSLLTPSKLEDLPSVARNLMQNRIVDCLEETLKINGIYSSASGLITAIISHLVKCQTQTLCTQGLLNALCGQVRDSTLRDQLARNIYQATDCWCPDPQKPYAILYNEDSDRLVPFPETSDAITVDEEPISLSGPLRRGLSAVLPWLETSHPVLIRGPDGCGKSTLITATLSTMKNIDSISLVKGSSLYGSQDLLIRLKRSCVKLDSTSQGRTYRPRNGLRLILILEDLHLASKDLQELIRELLQEGGFHEDDLEFAQMELAVLATADVSTKLHPRLEALFATHHLPYPNYKDIIAMVELHLKNSLKRDDVFVESWITKISPAMVDAYKLVQPSQDSSFSSWSPKDLALWADTLRYYPLPENETDLTRHLLDSGRRLFYPRLTLKEQTHWESIILSKVSEVKDFERDVYVWKTGTSGLIPFTEEQWKIEVQNAASKCAREGYTVNAMLSSHLLQIVSGICWTFGVHQRGIILAGRPGAGRKSTARLASTFSSLTLIESGPGRGRNAMKSAVQSAGIEGEPTILLLEEHHTREEGIAVLASAIISRGEFPGLLTPEELDGLVAPLAELSRREDYSGSLEQYLYHRLRANLRVIILLDTADRKEKWLLRSGLLRHCIFVNQAAGSEWWSLERPLTELAVERNKGESAGIKILVDSHLRVSIDQQAPARFLALLHTWNELRVLWATEVETQLQNLEAGINRLKEAGERVAKLEDEATKQRQELEAEKGRANAALEQITATMRGATGQRGEMTTLKAETERESAELARRKADIEGELGKVEPLVEQASQAVAGISTDALSEVRSLRAPPAPVRDILEGVLRLMGIRDTSWNSMKTFLAKRGVKDEIKSWDARRSTAASLEAVQKLVKERPDSFEEKTAKRASVAAAPLAAWVLANLQYGQILQQVAPLEREQRLLAERLSAAEAQLGRLAAGLSSVEGRVAQLQEQLAEHSRGAAALQLKTESTEASLATARTLLSKLDVEHSDWQQQFQELTDRRSKLDAEAANVASLLVYQDPDRDDEWKKSAIELLISERERLLWRAQGLPVDTESLVGASRALRGPLVPIFIDPSSVAVSWLKSNVGSNLETTKPEDPKFLTTLELAVRFGKPLLVEEVLELPPILLPLLKQKPLRLGDRTLQPQKGFKLFLATRRDHVDEFPREAETLLAKIKLGAGSRSLAERFVEKALLKETPELEVQRREALEREEKLAGERDAARLDLLAQLGRARGQDLLQESQSGQSGGGLLASLEATQSKAKEIAIALEESRRSLEDVSRRTQEHSKLAKFAANLFKSVKALSHLNSLYVFSPEAFTSIYLEAESSRVYYSSENKEEEEELVQKRLIALTLHQCTKAAYRKHRLPLALHLALSLNPVADTERSLLLEGSAMLTSKNESDLKLPDWIPEERAPAVGALVSVLPQILEKLKPTWLQDVNSVYSEKSLTPFQKVLAIQALRPDYLHTALSKLAAEQLGVKELTPPPWTLKKVSEETTAPVLLLLSPGADPGPELNSLASPNCTFTEISLGQGQVHQAEAALKQVCRTGGWILLSNLQLALNWLPRLEGLLRSPMCTSERHETTRIWLTTEECQGFYPALAGLCLKLAYEPPEGVKRNVKRSIQQLQHRDLGSSRGILLLAWLHGVLQERRRFIPQGWIKSYDWSEADLEAACELVLKRMSSDKLDWEGGRGLLDVAIYGGRLQDDFDMRALRSIIRNVWSKEIFEGRRELGGVLRISDNIVPIKALDQLDESDPPREYFGLPANAHRAWERAAAESALALLKSITYKIRNHNGDRSKKRLETKAQKDIKDLLERCRRMSVSQNNGKPPQNLTPLERFFSDEKELTWKLLGLIRSDVEKLRFQDSKTPKHWLAEWPGGPKEVVPFVKGLLVRHTILDTVTDLPEKIDLAALNRPTAFLAALKLQTARENGYLLENLKLRAKWLENERKSDWNPSICIEGLLISGALIKDGTLMDLHTNSAPLEATPVCQVAFLPEEPTAETDNEAVSDSLVVPVYADPQRTLLVCSIPVRCPRDAGDVWSRRGVALHLKHV